MTSEDGAREDPSGPGSMEPRWPASLAVAAALVLYMTLPGTLTIGPGWVIPVLEAALLIPLTVRAPYRHREEVRLIRLASLLLIALVSLAVVASLVLMVNLVLSGDAVTGRQLIFSGIQIWLTLILVFSLWYWEVDRGGPGIRGEKDQAAPDFLFPQMGTHELGQSDWMPGIHGLSVSLVHQRDGVQPDRHLAAHRAREAAHADRGALFDHHHRDGGGQSGEHPQVTV